ncbi:serine aminopeptidase domain-containing protein [Paraburkholderia sp. GAS334]|uniref:serine aminopeptidase domain-containing protein n=1 Tax=Paraburkholderia sp. GAS334 TaxID=3035131 RepID=UPI003D25114A
MKPVVFGGHFGWLHPGHGDRAVVLCNPLGHEAMWLHQTIRQLAEKLSERGVTTLRFDYLGTGDSADLDGLLRPDDWAGEVLQAVAYVKSVTGVERVSLAGFRFGALVAALAAERSEIESVAMIAPVVSMRGFMREMSILHQTWLQKAQITAADLHTPADAFDLLGHRYSAEAMETLGKLDLRQSRHAPASRVLLVHSGQRDGCDALAAHFEACGARVDAAPFEDFLETFQPGWQTELPKTVLKSATDWLAADTALLPHAGTLDGDASPSIVTSSAIECPVQFDDGRLFGVLCEPASKGMPRNTTPVLLIANTAGTHHVGDGRFSVELARQLALLGYASLRMDADGIGDSQGAAVPRSIGSLPLDGIAADLSRAADWLAGHGYRDVAVFGICAGGYAALRAAQSNPTIRALILVNPVGFLFPDGCSMRAAANLQSGSPRAHLRSMVRAGKWAQVMRGQVRLAPVLRTMWRHARAHARALIAAWTNEAFDTATQSYHVRQAIRRLDASGVHIRMLFSPRDHSLDELHLHFGVSGHRLRKLARVRALVFRNMDHEVLDRVARDHVIAVCHSFLHEAFFTTAMNEAPAGATQGQGVTTSTGVNAGDSARHFDAGLRAGLRRARKSV